MRLFKCFIILCFALNFGFAQNYFGEAETIIETLITSPTDLKAADLDANGFDDLIVLGNANSTIYLVANEGDEKFASPQLLLTVDNGGDMDIVYGSPKRLGIQTTLDLRPYPAGLYYLKIEFSDGSMQTKELVVYH